jgi:hypothetical protein
MAVQSWCIAGRPAVKMALPRTFAAVGVEPGVMMHGDGRPGAFLVHGAIYNTYMGMGGPGSWLGWPTGNEYTYWNGCFNTQRQNFVSGYITQDCGGTWRAY